MERFTIDLSHSLEARIQLFRRRDLHLWLVQVVAKKKQAHSTVAVALISTHYDTMISFDWLFGQAAFIYAFNKVGRFSAYGDSLHEQ